METNIFTLFLASDLYCTLYLHEEGQAGTASSDAQQSSERRGLQGLQQLFHPAGGLLVEHLTVAAPEAATELLEASVGHLEGPSVPRFGQLLSEDSSYGVHLGGENRGRCTHACTHKNTHTLDTHTHACLHACIHSHVLACMYTLTCTHTHVRMHAHTHTHLTRAHTHTHTCAHTHTHVRTHTYTAHEVCY